MKIKRLLTGVSLLTATVLIFGSIPVNATVRDNLSGQSKESVVEDFVSEIGDTTADESYLLAGKKAWIRDGENIRLITGSILNASADKTSLNAGETSTITAGTYVDKDIKITANGLSGQTSGTATADQILSGKTAWVNGTEVTGALTDKSNQNVNVTSVSENAGNVLISIPESGYYDLNSKISIPLSTLSDNCNSLASNSVIGSVNWPASGYSISSGRYNPKITFSGNHTTYFVMYGAWEKSYEIGTAWDNYSSNCSYTRVGYYKPNGDNNYNGVSAACYVVVKPRNEVATLELNWVRDIVTVRALD